MSKISELEQKMNRLTREAFQMEEYGLGAEATAKLAGVSLACI